MTPPNFDLPTFFAYARRAPFGGRLTQAQVAGCETVLDAWTGDDDRHLAYILATAFHETGGKMQPVREGFARSDSAARRIVARRRYGVEKNGHVYYGRGLVQLTWERNYRKAGEVLGLDLVGNPDLALDPAVSARLLVDGMTAGLFTGKKLADYFNATTDDPEGARRIVNGTDKASLIAGYHRNFLDSITAARAEARKKTPAPERVVEAARPDGAPLHKDRTMLGGLLAGGAGVAGFARQILEGIDSPWAFATFALILVCAMLVITGRVKLQREGGV